MAIEIDGEMEARSTEIWKRSMGGGGSGKDGEGGERKGCERGRLSRYDVLTGWRRGDELPAGGASRLNPING